MLLIAFSLVTLLIAATPAAAAPAPLTLPTSLGSAAPAASTAPLILPTGLSSATATATAPSPALLTLPTGLSPAASTAPSPALLTLPTGLSPAASISTSLGSAGGATPSLGSTPTNYFGAAASPTTSAGAAPVPRALSLSLQMPGAMVPHRFFTVHGHVTPDPQHALIAIDRRVRGQWHRLTELTASGRHFQFRVHTGSAGFLTLRAAAFVAIVSPTDMVSIKPGSQVGISPPVSAAVATAANAPAGTSTPAALYPVLASYYTLYGNLTACGETLEPSTLGVANKTLPCGTLVTIFYHGHTITVPVIDRGPYVAGRDFDLTGGLAAAINFDTSKGVDTIYVNRS